MATLLVNLKGDGLLTSPVGFGGSAQTLDLMIENIGAWGKCSTGKTKTRTQALTRALTRTRTLT